jgi:hypothetical protein
MKKNRSSLIDRNRKAIAGVHAHYAQAPQIVLGGVPYAPADVVKILQDQIDAIDAAAAAKVAFHQATVAEKAAGATASAVFQALKARVLSDFKAKADVVGDFGLTVPVRRKPAPATVVKANEKRKETRASRHAAGAAAPTTTTGPAPAAPPATTPHA